MDTNPHRYCVIMCGGIGSRFWPYSRTRMPKQFIDFLGTDRTLLQMSFDRISGIVSPSNIIVVSNSLYADFVHEQLPELPPETLFSSPPDETQPRVSPWLRGISPRVTQRHLS